MFYCEVYVKIRIIIFFRTNDFVKLFKERAGKFKEAKGIMNFFAFK